MRARDQSKDSASASPASPFRACASSQEEQIQALKARYSKAQLGAKRLSQNQYMQGWGG